MPKEVKIQQLVQDLSNKMKEFEDNVHEDFIKRQTPKYDNLSKKPSYYQHEDDNYLYFVNLGSVCLSGPQPCRR